jgi:hypothetical protein
MAEKLYEDLHFILDAAPRLVRIASMSVICLGLAEGSNDRLLGSNPPTDHDWHQSLVGYRHCSLMMVVINLASLLDRDDRALSFQAVRRLLKLDDVRSTLFAHLERQNGPDGGRTEGTSRRNVGMIEAAENAAIAFRHSG